MPIAIQLLTALVTLAPEIEALIPIAQRELAGTPPTAEELAQVEAITASLNAQVDQAEKDAGAT